jgi:uncharacterized protein YcbX
MARVAALYRYPVKGFAPERCETLWVGEGGRIAGDRVLGFRFGDSRTPGNAWGPKQEFVALVNTPGLARLRARFDQTELRLGVESGGTVLADEALEEEGRRRIAAAVECFVLGLDINPLADHPQRRPLRLVGDGVTPRFHDNEAGQTTLHGRASLVALAEALGDPELSELRFRSNIAVEGLRPWEEQEWLGRRVWVGRVQFRVVQRKRRCLATHANPATGERDRSVLATLVRAFAQSAPTFAVGLETIGPGGPIAVGDPVEPA